MPKREKIVKPAPKKATKLKKRRLGTSKLGIIEVVPREIADAEIERDFENSKLFPDEDQ